MGTKYYQNLTTNVESLEINLFTPPI